MKSAESVWQSPWKKTSKVVSKSLDFIAQNATGGIAWAPVWRTVDPLQREILMQLETETRR